MLALEILIVSNVDKNLRERIPPVGYCEKSCEYAKLTYSVLQNMFLLRNVKAKCITLLNRQT